MIQRFTGRISFSGLEAAGSASDLVAGSFAWAHAAGEKRAL